MCVGAPWVQCIVEAGRALKRPNQLKKVIGNRIKAKQKYNWEQANTSTLNGENEKVTNVKWPEKNKKKEKKINRIQPQNEANEQKKINI